MVKTSIKAAFYIRICMIMLACAPSVLPAQCLIAPAAPAWTGTETLATDGQTLGSGSTAWINSGTVTYGSLTMNGGTLVIAGNVTITNLTFTSGTIYVEPGATFTVPGSGALVLSGGCYFYNYGTVNMQRGLVLDGAHASAASPNVLINAGTSSVFNVAFDWMDINNAYSWMVNEGTINTHGIITDNGSSAGSVCLGPKSKIYQSYLINNTKYAYTSPSGPACVSVSSNASICEQVTADADVYFCLGASEHTDSSCLLSRGHTKAWGSGTLFTSCGTCGSIAVLPLTFDEVRAFAGGAVNFIQWRMHIGDHAVLWRVERSEDGMTYVPMACQVTSAGTADSYRCEDQEPPAGVAYYRIVCAALSYGEWRSGVVMTTRARNFTGPVVTPNPFHSEFSIKLPSGEQVRDVTLLDALGIRLVYIRPAAGDTNVVINGEHFPAGCYFVRIVTDKRAYLQRVLRR